MRLRTLVSLAALGAAAVALFRRTRPRRAEPLIPDVDPKDSVQALDDVVVLHVEELGIDALPHAEAQGLSELEMIGGEIETDNWRGDSGELYGQHVPPAVDRTRTHPDDDRAQAGGENWVEALLEGATEDGPEPERVLDMADENDITNPSTDARDLPIADRGSAGPRGL